MMRLSEATSRGVVHPITPRQLVWAGVLNASVLAEVACVLAGLVPMTALASGERPDWLPKVPASRTMGFVATPASCRSCRGWIPVPG